MVIKLNKKILGLLILLSIPVLPISCTPVAIEMPLGSSIPKTSAMTTVPDLTTLPVASPTVTNIIQSSTPVASITPAFISMPTQSILQTIIPIAQPSIIGITPTPSSTSFATSTPAPISPNISDCPGGGSAGGVVIYDSFVNCRGEQISANVTNISSVDITDPLFVSYTITGTNFYYGKTSVDSVFYTNPETSTTASNVLNDTTTVERNQSESIAVAAIEKFTDTGSATAHLVNINTIKVKVPKSLFTSDFNFSAIKVSSVTKNPTGRYLGEFLPPTIKKISPPDITDPVFVTYTITGTNFYPNATRIRSNFYTPLYTDSNRDNTSFQNSGSFLSRLETNTDTGVSTSSLVNSNTIKVKIPKSIFKPGFEFSAIRVYTTIYNPEINNEGFGPIDSPYLDAVVNSISPVDLTDPEFVSYTITGTNFYIFYTKIDSILYNSTTLEIAKETYINSSRVERTMNLEVVFDGTPIYNTIANLINANTIKVKVPKYKFYSGFDFSNIKVGSSVKNIKVNQIITKTGSYNNTIQD